VTTTAINPDFLHPATLNICGAHSSGKTTLMRQLLSGWQGRYMVGCFKYNAPESEVDRSGPESALISESGAAQVVMSHPFRQAVLIESPLDLLQKRQLFQNCDFVLAEGKTTHAGPKLLLLDAEGRLLEQYRAGAFSDVLALIVDQPLAESLPLPVLERNDLAGIRAVVESWLAAQKQRAPLYGLVLAGGHSRRMGQDKAHLDYHGRPQVEHVRDLLTPLCREVLISSREAADFPAYHVLPDRLRDFGPIGGILSALQHDPQAAWLVVAIDLPLLSPATLSHLIAHRNPLAMGTAFQNPANGLPEPLCAIYEPRFRERLFAFLGAGIHCPRKAMLNSWVELLIPPEAESLANANTPEEQARLRATLSAE
jgi:molybdopterin-guanine dinucleotide biosynthesis protein A